MLVQICLRWKQKNHHNSATEKENDLKGKILLRYHTLRPPCPVRVPHLLGILPSICLSTNRPMTANLILYSGSAKSQIKRQRAILWGFYLLEHTGRCWRSVQRQDRKSEKNLLLSACIRGCETAEYCVCGIFIY